MKIVIGISGSISAYKAANIVSLFKKKNFDVHVVMTKSAKRFISPMTLEVISQNKVFVGMFSYEDHTVVEHIKISQNADCVLIVPASYNIIGKIATGIADDMLTGVLAAYSGKVFVAPAMNTNMYENPIFKANQKYLEKHLDYIFIPPQSGLLACGDVGLGKLQDEQVILNIVLEHTKKKQLLKGKRVLVTAGATREYIDPIRYITNTSSGKMGNALAKAAQQMGAKVTLISGSYPLPTINDMKVLHSDTSEAMKDIVLSYYQDVDIVIMTAAVGDYRPKVRHEEKMKKKEGELSLKLERTTDILKLLGENKTHQTLIGFAAESSNLVENGKKKLAAKNLDYIVINNIKSFGSDDNSVMILSKDLKTENIQGLKTNLAFSILEKIFA